MNDNLKYVALRASKYHFEELFSQIKYLELVNHLALSDFEVLKRHIGFIDDVLEPYWQEALKAGGQDVN